MSEEFLCYIWAHNLYNQLSCSSFNGESITVVNPGIPNPDSGPDFFNAMIKSGSISLAGNIEIHVNASDWYKHGHHYNRDYDSVILQVVINNDVIVRRTTGEVIPTMEISFDSEIYSAFREAAGKESWIPCQDRITDIEPGIVRGWLNKLAQERLEYKSARVRDCFYLNKCDWEETMYQQVARGFGFRLNAAIFELLARSLPVNLLNKYSDNLLQIEALLFGQAGMLDAYQKGDCYFTRLCDEYRFLKNKHRLFPLGTHLWKFLRLRPANFPTIRIAQFAAFICATPNFFSVLTGISEISTLKNVLCNSTSEYWDEHYVFNRKSVIKRKFPGDAAIRSLIINSIVPVLYYYGNSRQMKDYQQRALMFMRELPSENNRLIHKWRKSGVTASNAAQSQALLQLKHMYCENRLCYKCDIGRSISNKKSKKNTKKIQKRHE